MTKKYFETQAMWEKNKDPKALLKLLADKLVKENPQREALYIPYIKSPVAKREQVLGREIYDLKKMYPDAKDGDTAYVCFNIESEEEKDIFIVINEEITVFSENDIVHSPKFNGEEYVNVQTRLKKGINKFALKCVCTKTGFGFKLMLTSTAYPFMWARDCIMSLRATIPLEEFSSEEGAAYSRLFKEDEKEEMRAFESGKREFVFPKAKKCEDFKDIGAVYGEEKGKCVYAYTSCAKDGYAEFVAASPLSIFINGTFVCNVNKEEKTVLRLKECDKILLKCFRDEKWGFVCKDTLFKNDLISSNRKSGDKWLFIGSFGNEMTKELLFAPEKELSFDSPYYNEEGKKVFWRLADGSHIRIYSPSHFYGTWNYPVMVGHFGLVKTAEVLNDKKLLSYFAESMRFAARYFEYAVYDAKEFENNPSILPRCASFNHLDPIGTIGMNMQKAYFYTGDRELLNVIKDLALSIMTQVPKFENGAYHRVKTMWTDDLFMSVPFLLGMEKITGDSVWEDRAATMFLTYTEKMYMDADNVFSHIYYVEKGEKTNVPWGRGNGWVFVALTEFLEKVGKDNLHFEKIKEIFQNFSRGIAALQDKNGLWHQVLDKNESYAETSCTAMFLYGFSKGIRLGILGDEYVSNANKALEGLLKNQIDCHGNIYGVCKGSSCSSDWKYYSERLGTVKNDDHGTGILLAAMCEYVLMQEEKNRSAEEE